MTVGELILINKERYTKVFLIQGDEENRAQFTEVNNDNVDPNLVMVEAKDYFLLDKEGVDEIFGNADELGISEDDQALMIGL